MKNYSYCILAVIVFLVFNVYQCSSEESKGKSFDDIILKSIKVFLGSKTDHNEFMSHNLTLKKRLDLEKTTFHWYPYKRIIVHTFADILVEDECWTRPRAIDEFPQGWWTRKSLKMHKNMIRS